MATGRKRRYRISDYRMPTEPGDDPASNMAIFLTLTIGTCLSDWHGHMRAIDQRRLFGRFLGKGLIHIDGRNEMLYHVRKVCFGLDWDITHSIPWRELERLK